MSLNMVGEIVMARLELIEGTSLFCYLGYTVRWPVGSRNARVSHADLEKLLDCINSRWCLLAFAYVVGM